MEFRPDLILDPTPEFMFFAVAFHGIVLVGCVVALVYAARNPD